MSKKSSHRKTSNGMIPVAFELEADPGSQVFVAGSFNDWNPQQHKLDPVNGSGRFRKELMLPRGQHEYKFIVNDSWINDQQNPASVPNDLGSTNSLLVIG